MVNLIFAFINTIIGYVLIIQYGNDRAAFGKKKYWDWLLILACLNMMVAGMNISKFAEMR